MSSWFTNKQGLGSAVLLTMQDSRRHGAHRFPPWQRPPKPAAFGLRSRRREKRFAASVARRGVVVAVAPGCSRAVSWPKRAVSCIWPRCRAALASTAAGRIGGDRRRCASWLSHARIRCGGAGRGARANRRCVGGWRQSASKKHSRESRSGTGQKDDKACAHDDEEGRPMLKVGIRRKTPPLYVVPFLGRGLARARCAKVWRPTVVGLAVSGVSSLYVPWGSRVPYGRLTTLPNVRHGHHECHRSVPGQKLDSVQLLLIGSVAQKTPGSSLQRTSSL